MGEAGQGRSGWLGHIPMRCCVLSKLSRHAGAGGQISNSSGSLLAPAMPGLHPQLPAVRNTPQQLLKTRPVTTRPAPHLRGHHQRLVLAHQPAGRGPVGGHARGGGQRVQERIHVGCGAGAVGKQILRCVGVQERIHFPHELRGKERVQWGNTKLQVATASRHRHHAATLATASLADKGHGSDAPPIPAWCSMVQRHILNQTHRWPGAACSHRQLS